MEYGVKSHADNCMARNIDLYKIVLDLLVHITLKVSYKIRMFAHNIMATKIKSRLHEFACSLKFNPQNLLHIIML